MPLSSQVHKNTSLTNFSLRYTPGTFIADRVLPLVPVMKLSDDYFIYGKDNLRIDSAGPLGTRTPARQADWSVSTATYTLRRYSLFDLITDEEVDNADPAIDSKEDAVMNLMDKIYLEREQKAAAAVFSTTNLTNNTTLSGTDQWSDYNNSDPISDLEIGLGSVEDNVRKDTMELSLVMGRAVWRKVRHHPSIVSRFQYTSGGGVTRAQFAELLDINPNNLMIGSSGYNSANEGQVASMADVWGKHVVAAYINPNPTLRSITLGSTFVKSGEAVQVYEWRNSNPEGDNVRPETYYDQKIVAADAGYMIENAVA